MDCSNRMIDQPNDWTIDYFTVNEADCIRVLDRTDALKQIPSLDSAPLDLFKDGQLVRFRGMVQDMHNPEYFFKNYQVVDTKSGQTSSRCGMYKDGARCQPHEQILVDSGSNESSERQTWIVISTPGLNDWAKANNASTVNKNVKSKMPFPVDNNKRSLDEGEEPMDCSEPVRKKEKLSSDNSNAGSSQSNESKPPMIVSKEHILNFPVPNETGKACIVKIYKEYPFKLNQVIDIIGFLSLDPNLSISHDPEEMESDIERQTHHPPASIVPRLHAIKIIEENNERFSDVENTLVKAEKVRGHLRIILSQILFGDELAADYLICNLISSIYLRRECLCLGGFPLNITNIPKQHANCTKEIYEILKQIIAKSHFLDVTLESLNDMSFIPKKDYECNRLNSGVLQLSKNTHLVIDETNLSAGQITSYGRQNYSAIGDMIKFQKLAYDFQYYTIDYEMDIPVVIFSEVKSFIPCKTQVVLRPDTETVNVYPQVLEAAKLYLKDETKLNDMRQYVNTLKNAKFSFTNETDEIIQQDFVRLRQTNRNFDGDDLHSLMTFSRLMSLSHGFNSLQPPIWKKCVEMEIERISRLQKRD